MFTKKERNNTWSGLAGTVLGVAFMILGVEFWAPLAILGLVIIVLSMFWAWLNWM